MDKLQEPDFTRDKEFPRLLHGVEEMQKASIPKFQKYFFFLSAASIYRYYREIYFYQGGLVKLLGVAGLFTFSSYQIAKFLTEDPYVAAAEINNQNEREYISKYAELYRSATRLKLRLPDHLIQ